MSSLNFSKSELTEMLKFYQGQYSEAVARLNHIQSMISKLTGNIADTAVEPVAAIAVAASPVKETVSVPKTRVATTPKTRKKRGRQPIWAELILKSLKKFERPLTYKDLYREAKIQGGFTGDEKDAQIKAAVNQSVNRLRTVNNKITSVKVEGRTGKYLALNKWLNEDGSLIDEYSRRVI